MSSYNCRSLAPKANSLVEDFDNRNYIICYLSEIWQENSKSASKTTIQSLLEENQIKYMSTPRRGGKRGGGAAIAWKHEEVNIKKLNIHIPSQVEAVWGICKSKSSGILKEILLCSFYSPPNTGKNLKLVSVCLKKY